MSIEICVMNYHSSNWLKFQVNELICRIQKTFQKQVRVDSSIVRRSPRLLFCTRTLKNPASALFASTRSITDAVLRIGQIMHFI